MVGLVNFPQFEEMTSQRKLCAHSLVNIKCGLSFRMITLFLALGILGGVAKRIDDFARNGFGRSHRGME